MKTYHKILICVLIIMVCGCNTRQKTGTTKYNFSLLDSQINGWIQKQYYPGASIVIAHKGEIVFQKLYGNYTEQTEVYIASAGKWLASATIATIVEQTALQGNDPIKKWLPEFIEDPKGKIQLRQLLSHTSGIPDYHPYPKQDSYNNLADAVAEIIPMELVFAPGSRFQYGGLAMQIAGRIAEVAAGKDFETLFQENIAQPLGMKNTHFTPVSTEAGHNPMLGGGARTILPDYINFLDMMYHKGNFKGQRILSEQSVNQLMADHIGEAKVLAGEYVEKGVGENHSGIYGLGLWREKVDEQNMAYQVSSPGWAGAYPWINTRDEIYGFFLTHVEGSAARNDGYSPFYNAPKIAAMASLGILSNKGK